VKTPDAFWKVILRGTGQGERAIAWIIPNSQDAKHNVLNQYLMTMNEIEHITGEQLPVAKHVKQAKLKASRIIPLGCNKG
jgi:endonuclease G